MKDYNEIIQIQKKKIRDFIESPYYNEFMSEDEIARIFQVPEEDMELFRFVISELVSEGALMMTKKNRLSTPGKAGYFKGSLRTNERGFGFVSCEGLEDDVFVTKRDLNGAAHTDTVLVKIIGREKDRPIGKIERIIRRGQDSITGVFSVRRKGGTVAPRDRRCFKRVDIDKKDVNGASEGDVVVVKIIHFPDKKRIPKGRVIRILGSHGDKGVDVLEVMEEKHIPQDFPHKVLEELENIPMTVENEDISDREDFRGVQTVTIDGEDAKDLDDAVSCRRLENGNYELGVYIADVSHYVRQGEALDEEAFKRGTSVYLVDRVIPMLPKELSNGICSLNQGEDRLCLCCIMEIDKNGRVVDHRTVKGVINVDRRMTYTVVNDILTDEESAYAEEYRDFVPMFVCMKELRDILLKKRVKRGALSFDITEAKVILDEEGKPVDIVPRRRNVATSIIEEFMIAANETVAEEFFALGAPFMYRNHEMPDEEKYEMLKSTVGRLGYVLKGDRKNPKNLQRLLDETKGKPNEAMIGMLALRSMQQARYNGEDPKHYGLASECYCHFTSPIRRYPDLFIHRIISAYKDGMTVGELKDRFGKELSKKADLCSENERRAEMAERESVELKKAEFMADKVGETFEGVVSGVTAWGVYLQLPNTIEGMVSYKTMEDDVYIYDEESMSCMGERTHRTYNIGDHVTVVLERADVEMRRLDFVFEMNMQRRYDEEKTRRRKKNKKRAKRRKAAKKRRRMMQNGNGIQA